MFYYNDKRIFVGSIRSLKTKLRLNKPVLNEEGTNVTKELSTGKTVEERFPKGTIVKYVVEQKPYTTVGYGKKPSGKSSKPGRKSGTAINVSFLLK